MRLILHAHVVRTVAHWLPLLRIDCTPGATGVLPSCAYCMLLAHGVLPGCRRGASRVPLLHITCVWGASGVLLRCSSCLLVACGVLEGACGVPLRCPLPAHPLPMDPPSCTPPSCGLPVSCTFRVRVAGSMLEGSSRCRSGAPKLPAGCASQRASCRFDALC